MIRVDRFFPTRSSAPKNEDGGGVLDDLYDYDPCWTKQHRRGLITIPVGRRGQVSAQWPGHSRRTRAA